MDAIQAEAALHVAAAALGVQVVLALLLLLGVHLGGDGQHVVIHRQADVLLLHAGELSLQAVGFGLFLHVHAEAGGADHVVHVEERAEEAVIKQAVHGVGHVGMTMKRNDGIHKITSFTVTVFVVSAVLPEP